MEQSGKSFFTRKRVDLKDTRIFFNKRFSKSRSRYFFSRVIRSRRITPLAETGL
jgi:hypothetical protein